jgi:hypothetical protein
MHTDIFARLSDTYSWNASLRIRHSSALKMGLPHSNCLFKGERVATFPVIGRSATIAFEFGPAGRAGTHVVLQCAHIHSDNRGRRLIRIFTFAFPASADAAIVCASVDEAALAAMLARRAATALLATGTTAAAHALARDVRSLFARGIRFSVLYHFVHGLVCNPVFRLRRPLDVDHRMSLLTQVRAMGVAQCLLLLYPRLIPLDANQSVLPLTRASLESGECFIFHLWNKVCIGITRSIQPAFLKDAFGVTAVADIPGDLPAVDTEVNHRLRALVERCWAIAGTYLPVEVLADLENQHQFLQEVLVDDSVACGANLFNWMAAGFGGDT